MRPSPVLMATLGVLLALPTPTGAGAPSLTDPAHLKAPVDEPGLRFGAAVAAEGHALVVGAPGQGEGRVHVYRYTPGLGASKAATLAPPDGVDRFGAALDLDAGRLVVGAPGSLREPGAAVLYARQAPGDWARVATLEAPAPAGGDRFGARVALDGDRLAVASPGLEQGAGAVHLYEVAPAPTHVARLAPHDEDAARFGAALALDADRLIVGAPGARVDGARAGAVHLVDARDGTLLDTAPSPAPRAAFGASLALAGPARGTVLVGAPNGPGAVHVYAVDGDRLAREAALDAPRDRLRFGQTVATSGEAALVTEAGDARARWPATVHRYAHTPDGWTPQGTTASTADPHAGLGAALALAPAGALVGAPFAVADTARAGAAAWHPADPATPPASGLATWPLSS